MTHEPSQDRRQGYSLRGHIARIRSSGGLTRVGLAAVALLAVSGVTFARCRSADITGPGSARHTATSGGSADLLESTLAIDPTTEMNDIMEELGITLLSSSGSTPSATGGVEYLIEEGQSGLLPDPDPVSVPVKLAFSAITHPDGTFDGQYSFRQPNLDINVHGEVVCVVAVGTTATVAGRVTGSNSLLHPERSFNIFTVQDNGEGGADEPRDVASLVHNVPVGDVGDDLSVLCAVARPERFPISKGNVQVRSGEEELTGG